MGHSFVGGEDILTSVMVGRLSVSPLERIWAVGQRRVSFLPSSEGLIE